MLITQTLPNIFGFSRASKAWDVDANGNLTEYAVNALRDGFDPATRLPAGWLLEGASTNLLLQSETLTTAPWTAENVTLAPAGALGWKMTETAATAVPHRINQSVGGIPDNADCVLWFDAAAGERNWLWIGANVKDATLPRVWFDLAAGTVGTPSGAVLASGMIPLGGGAYRCWLRFNILTGVSTPVIRAAAATGNGVVSYDGSATSGLYLRRGQLEANYLASSYIPTLGAAAPRAADSLVCSGAAFAAIFGAAAPQGWLVCDVMLAQQTDGTNPQIIAQLDDGTENNRLALFNTPGGLTLRVFNSVGSINTANTVNTITLGAPFRCGMRWDATGIAFCLNGGAIVLDARAGVVPPGLSMLRLGARSNNTRNLNGRVRGVWGGPNGSVADTPFRTACTLGTDPDEVLRT